MLLDREAVPEPSASLSLNRRAAIARGQIGKSHPATIGNFWPVSMVHRPARGLLSQKP
jgi:hypothetical protein